VRCPRCGNENPATNRFCGMCGATLLPADPPAEAAPLVDAPVPAPSPVPPPPAARVTEHRVTEPLLEEESPVISGPSFLGLNQPAPRKSASGARRRGSLSIDPNAAPAARDLDYLLEDEEPRHGGGWKAVAIFLALALAVGMGYLRWRNQGFGWLNPSAEKHAAAPSSETATAAPSNPTGAPSEAAPAAAPASPAATADNSAASPAPATGNPAPAGSNAPDAATASAPPAASQPSASPGSSALPAVPLDAKQPSASAPPAQPAASKDGAASADDATPPPARAKPSAASEAPKPVKTADPVAEAQKYLYGKGVPQNCDRGLRLLKPAADHANPKAMVEMGALYSAGLCTPRDLPTAYRWFALALRKEPDNDSVQADLKKLWGEMTQPERQLAIKLSQ